MESGSAAGMLRGAAGRGGLPDAAAAAGGAAAAAAAGPRELYSYEGEGVLFHVGGGAVPPFRVYEEAEGLRIEISLFNMQARSALARAGVLLLWTPLASPRT